MLLHRREVTLLGAPKRGRDGGSGGAGPSKGQRPLPGPADLVLRAPDAPGTFLAEVIVSDGPQLRAVVRALLSIRSDWVRETEDGVPLLVYAAQEGMAGVVSELLVADYDPREQHEGLTAIEWAALYNKVDVLRVLMPYKTGTELERALEGNSPDAVLFLLYHGQEVRTEKSKQNEAWAVLKAHRLRKDNNLGAMPEEVTEAGRELHELVGPVEIPTQPPPVWEEPGFDSEESDEGGRMDEEKPPAVLSLLRKFPGVVDELSYEGVTPLYSAVEHAPEWVDALLGAGASVHTAAPDGTPLLVRAVARGEPEIVRKLLFRIDEQGAVVAAGANVHVRHNGILLIDAVEELVRPRFPLGDEYEAKAAAAAAAIREVLVKGGACSVNEAGPSQGGR